jgi:predicted NAD/FAD-binding protein
VSLAAEGGRPAARVDVPLRVFYPGYYPTLSRLYDELGVRSEPVSYDSSFIDAAGRLTFRYRNLLLGGRSISYLAPADFLAPQARPIVADVLRFNRRAAADLRAGRLQGRTIGEYVAREGCSAAFVEGFLLPAVCTVCTCPTAMARELPAEVVVDYLVRGLTRAGGAPRAARRRRRAGAAAARHRRACAPARPSRPCAATPPPAR